MILRVTRNVAVAKQVRVTEFVRHRRNQRHGLAKIRSFNRNDLTSSRCLIGACRPRNFASDE